MKQQTNIKLGWTVDKRLDSSTDNKNYFHKNGETDIGFLSVVALKKKAENSKYFFPNSL